MNTEKDLQESTEQALTIPVVVAMLPSESECTKWAEEAAMFYPPEQWTDGFEQGYERGMIAVIELIKEKLKGN